MLYLGCDIGLKGYWALLDSSGKVVSTHKMPLDKNKKFDADLTWKLLEDIDYVANCYNDFSDVTVALERPLVLPSDSNQLEALLRKLEDSLIMCGEIRPEIFDQLYIELCKTDGRVGNMTSGINFGILKGQCIAMWGKCLVYGPRTWQAMMHKTSSYKLNPKQRSYDVCRQLWPDQDLSGGKKKGFHDGLTDALLIAEFLRRSLRSSD